MKAFIYLLLTIFMFTSCDFFKNEENKDETAVINNDKVESESELDDNGCAVSAGYRWSVLRGDCIRVFEEGFRLNHIALDIEESEDFTQSCFAIFNSDKDSAELFFPDEKESVLLEYNNIDKIYSNDVWKLIIRDKEDWKLIKNHKLEYTSAKAIDIQITDGDEIEDL